MRLIPHKPPGCHCETAIFWPALVVSLSAVLLIACSDSSSDFDSDDQSDDPPSSVYSVGGEVQGLGSNELVLALNEGEELTLNGDGSFEFDSELSEGDDYRVDVVDQSDGIDCDIENADGEISDNDIDDILVICEEQTSEFSVAGNVDGLGSNELVLALNELEDISIDEDGPFQFDSTLQEGEEYRVEVIEQADSRFCDIDNAIGEIGSSDVDDVSVSCSEPQLNANNKEGSVRLDWHREQEVEILYSTDPDCDWGNVSVCENGNSLMASGGGETLSVDEGDIQESSPHFFVKKIGGVYSKPVTATPLRFELDLAIRDLDVYEGKLYVAGHFSRHAAPTGGAAFFRADSPLAEQSGAFPDVDGPVYSVAEIPEKGWVIAGFFGEVQGHSRQNIALLKPDGRIDPDWHVSVPDAFITTIAVSEERIYIGGIFSSVEGNDDYQTVAALSHQGELIESFDPPEFEDLVWDFELNDGRLYVGGEFTNIGSIQSDYLVSLNAENGALDIDFSVQVDSDVYHVAKYDDQLLIGGVFGEVNEEERKGVAMLEIDSAELLPFDANLVDSQQGQPFVQSSESLGDDLLIGGRFSSVNGDNVNALARVSMDSAESTGFSHGLEEDAVILEVGVDGEYVYLAGGFDRISDESINHFARVDAVSGELDSAWDPGVSRDQVSGWDFSINDDFIVLAGDFTHSGGEARRGLASYSTSDMELRDWAPKARSGSGSRRGVSQFEIWEERIYSVGRFSFQEDGQAFENAVAYPLDGEVPLEWAPRTSGDSGGLVESIALNDQGDVYIGGRFDQVNDLDLRHLAKVDRGLGEPIVSNDPGIELSLTPSVQSIIPFEESHSVVVGGRFTEVDGHEQESIALLDSSDFSRKQFPQLSAMAGAAQVRAGERNHTASEPHFFIGGTFNAVNGEPVSRFAQLSLDGVVLDGPEFDETVVDIHHSADTDRLFLAFSDGFKVFTVDGTDLSLEHDFSSVLGDSGFVSTVVESEGLVAVGGDFDTYDGEPVHNLVVLDADSFEQVYPAKE